MSNSALDGAERKGREAALRGEPLSACPYEDKRTRRGAITYSRCFIRAWTKGHRSISDPPRLYSGDE